MPVLGQKCARLADVKARLGVGVPPFFAITSPGVRHILESGRIPDYLREEMRDRVREIEDETGQKFGGEADPLLFAVRSGDPISMVGTMTTLLNVGMTRTTLDALIEKHGEENAVSLWRMYLDLQVDMNRKAAGISRETMRELLQEMKQKPADIEKLGELVIKAQGYGYVLPQDIYLQLEDAVVAVARSWLGAASQNFKEAFQLEEDLYPSIMVQKKEYAAFVDRAYASFSTRSPLTGVPEISGDYALGTEGRSMMRGICLARRDIRSIDQHFPGTFDLLTAVAREAERLYKRPQDFETIILPQGELIVLQVNDFIMPAEVLAKVESDLQQEGILQAGEAMPRIEEIKRSLVIKKYRFNQEVDHQVIDRGRPVSPGAVEGQLVLDSREAVRVRRRGRAVVLFTAVPDERALNLILRREIDGFAATYHSVHDEVAARANHLPAVMGYKNVVVENGWLINKGTGQKIREGERVILDGDSGLILTSDNEQILSENGYEVWAPYNINGERMFKNIRAKYANSTYDQLLEMHAKYANRSKGLVPQNNDIKMHQKKTRLELLTHFVHLMLHEKGGEMGKSELQVNLDVSLADGNLERVPGLEKSNITVEKKPDGSCFIVFTTSVEYMGEEMEKEEVANAAELTREMIGELKKRSLKSHFATTQKKLTVHTNWVVRAGIVVPAEELMEVIAILRDKIN